MSYIDGLVKKKMEQRDGKITLERYIAEHSYIVKYLTRVIREKALSVYLVLFHLSWFETGAGNLDVKWVDLCTYFRSDRDDGNVLPTTVKYRMRDLFENNCVKVQRTRGIPNKVIVYLPSEISACRELMEQALAPAEEKVKKPKDYYTDPERRLEILKRDKYRCAYCRVQLDKKSYQIDHMVPMSRGGTNVRENLTACCEACNYKKLDKDVMEFLKQNYRNKLLDQNEYIKQSSLIEKFLESSGL